MTNRLVTKLYSLEVPDRSDVQQENVVENTSGTVAINRPTHDAAKLARQKIAEFVERIQAPPRGC